MFVSLPVNCRFDLPVQAYSDPQKDDHLPYFVSKVATRAVDSIHAPLILLMHSFVKDCEAI